MDYQKRDGFGFKLNNVTMQRFVKKSFESFIEETHRNTVITWLIGLPTSRTLFSILLASFLNLDRLQLYHYHDRPTSYYSAMLFNATNTLLQQTAQLVVVVPGIDYSDL